MLLVPLTAASYFTAGEMIFSYLRQQKTGKNISPLTFMRMSLEWNFVNHVLPSGGVSGISYMNWRLGKYGVPGGKATMAQVVRYVAGFAALATLLVVSVFVVTIDGTVNRWIILMSSGLVTMMIVATIFGAYLIRSPSRMRKLAVWCEKTINGAVRKITRGKKRVLVREEVIMNYFDDIHADYLNIMRDRKVLLQPYIWGLVYTVVEVAIFYSVFISLGTEPFNPAPLLIGYGVASVAGFLIATPGGTGAYEAVMVMILATAGMPEGHAIAGVVLARVIILITTIGLGYIFYQDALNRYGKPKNLT